MKRRRSTITMTTTTIGCGASFLLLVMMLFIASCGSSNPPATSPTSSSSTSSSGSSSSSSSGGSSTLPTCEFSLKNANLDCDKAWKNYETWLKAKCATGKADTQDTFMKACKTDTSPGVVASYGCFQRHSGCDDVLVCEGPCFEAAEALKSGKK